MPFIAQLALLIVAVLVFANVLMFLIFLCGPLIDRWFDWMDEITQAIRDRFK